MMRLESEPDMKITITKTIFFIAVALCIALGIFTQSKALLAKSENKKLQSQLLNVQASINKFSEENDKLELEIENKQSQYEVSLENLKIAYLTFDDGPSNHTLEILNTLDKYNVKATFFVNYKEGNEELYKEIVKRGHVLGNHTYSHVYSNIYSSKEAFVADVQKLDNELQKITGKEPSKIIRFPGGSNNTIGGSIKFMSELAKNMTDLGYTFFDWNIDSQDATMLTQRKDVIVNTILRDCQYVQHANILMHDSDPKVTTLEALPQIIEGLKAQGFVFDKLSHDSPKSQFIIMD